MRSQFFCTSDFTFEFTTAASRFKSAGCSFEVDDARFTPDASAFRPLVGFSLRAYNSRHGMATVHSPTEATAGRAHRSTHSYGTSTDSLHVPQHVRPSVTGPRTPKRHVCLRRKTGRGVGR